MERWGNEHGLQGIYPFPLPWGKSETPKLQHTIQLLQWMNWGYATDHV